MTRVPSRSLASIRCPFGLDITVVHSTSARHQAPACARTKPSLCTDVLTITSPALQRVEGFAGAKVGILVFLTCQCSVVTRHLPYKRVEGFAGTKVGILVFLTCQCSVVTQLCGTCTKVQKGCIGPR